MRIGRFQRLSGMALMTLVVALVAGYAYLSWMRSNTIREVTALAAGYDGGDQVEALVAYLASDVPSLEEKNRAIWVLGELRDERALETLTELQVSDECDHDLRVCQREVRKAIRKVNGEIPNPYL